MLHTMYTTTGTIKILGFFFGIWFIVPHYGWAFFFLVCTPHLEYSVLKGVHKNSELYFGDIGERKFLPDFSGPKRPSLHPPRKIKKNFFKRDAKHRVAYTSPVFQRLTLSSGGLTHGSIYFELL